MIATVGERSRRSFQAIQPALTEHLRANATRYFECFAGQDVRVALVHKTERQTATVCEFLMTSNGQRHSVMLKSYHPNRPTQGGASGAEIPRVISWLRHDVRVQMEFDALSAIQAHFRTLSDARFATVRVLDFLPEQVALVTEKLPYRNLNDLLCRQHRMQSSSEISRLRLSVHNAGAWLRGMHKLAHPD